MKMRRIFSAILALACVVMATSCDSKKATITNGDPNKMDSLSYCFGVNIGSDFRAGLSDVPFDMEALKKGMTESMTKTAKQSDEEAVEILQEFFTMSLGERRQAIQMYKADSTSSEKAPQIFENETERTDISYALGNNIGGGLVSSKVPFQIYWVTKGLRDAFEGNSEISSEEAMKFLQHYFTVVRPREAAERSEKWLKKMEKSWGVKKTESGLLYKVIEQGDMTKAAKNDEDIVEVHYVGKLQDGTVFDASRFEERSEEQKEMIRKARPDLFDEKGNFTEKDEPIKFPLNRVIKGWGEGVKLVGPGGVIKLYIPAELAYGARGAGRDIGPNEALEFEVAVISVEPYIPLDTEVPGDETPAEAK